MADGTALAPAHVIIGDDDFLRERQRRTLISQLQQHAPEKIPVTTVRAGDINGPELLELLSPSLFAEDRVVVVTAMHDAGKEPAELIIDALKEPAPGITIFIEHSGKGRTAALLKKLRAAAEVHTVEPPKSYELPRFVASEFRHEGIQVTQDVCAAVVDCVGSDLRELASAVSQLIADNAGEVDLYAVYRLYQGSAEVTGFNIADAVIAGQSAAAIAQTRRALQLGLAPMAISTAVGRTMSDIARLNGATRVDYNQDARVYGMPPWKLKKLHPIARRWSSAAVAQAVVITAQMEAGVKGQSGDAEATIEWAVAQLVQLAQSR